MKPHNPRFLRLISDIKAELQEINVVELQEALAKQPNLMIIDVREASELAATGHIPGAKHLSKGIIERDIEATVADITRPIVVYCSGGFRSLLVANNLQKMGYQQVRSLTGGFSAWQAANAPIQTIHETNLKR